MNIQSSYIDEFREEYNQLNEKLKKLKDWIEDIMTEGCSEVVPLDILQDQKKAMCEYKHSLEIRAILEGIEL